jgi:hypothetical protein
MSPPRQPTPKSSCRCPPGHSSSPPPDCSTTGRPPHTGYVDILEGLGAKYLHQRWVEDGKAPSGVAHSPTCSPPIHTSPRDNRLCGTPTAASSLPLALRRAAPATDASSACRGGSHRPNALPRSPLTRLDARPARDFGPAGSRRHSRKPEQSAATSPRAWRGGDAWPSRRASPPKPCPDRWRKSSRVQRFVPVQRPRADLAWFVNCLTNSSNASTSKTLADSRNGSLPGLLCGADDGIRTRDPHLGKVMVFVRGDRSAPLNRLYSAD